MKSNLFDKVVRKCFFIYHRHKKLFLSVTRCIGGYSIYFRVSSIKNPLNGGLLQALRVSAWAYFMSESTLWGCWLAWASMAVAACWMIWVLDSVAEAVA